MPTTETIPIWFQRSGSITVLLSLIAEYIISRLHSIIKPAGLTSEATAKIRKLLEPPLMYLRYIGAVIAGIGTIIWGYGDLFV